MNYPEPGKIYKHYKGGLYEFLFLSVHTETNEILVIYKSILFGTNYARPLTEWNKKTKDGEKRFEIYEHQN